jgi:hypothetical protein
MTGDLSDLAEEFGENAWEGKTCTPRELTRCRGFIRSGKACTRFASLIIDGIPYCAQHAAGKGIGP